MSVRCELDRLHMEGHREAQKAYHLDSFQEPDRKFALLPTFANASVRSQANFLS